MTFEDYKKSRLGTKYIRRLKIPNTDIEIGLTVLTTQKLLEAESAKIEYLKLNGLVDSENASMLENNVQVIYRSAVNPENGSKYFESTDQTRQMIGEDLMYLSDQYIQLTQEINPAMASLNELDIEDIKKKLLNGEVPIGLNYSQLLQALMVLGGFKSTSTTDVEQSSDVQ